MKFTLFSLLAFLALPAWGTAQETYPYPDVWRTAGTHLLPPDRVKALIGWIGPGVKHRDGGCFPLPTWGTGNRADEAAAELVLVGTPAIDALIPLLRDQEAGRRQMVVEIFGRIGNRRVTPLLTPLLQSEKDDSVRESVAESLAMLRDPQAEKPLIQALQDKSEFVQEDAVRGLGWLKSSQAIAPLIAFLRQARPAEGGLGRSAVTGTTAAVALAAIGAPALPPLLDLLTDPTTPANALCFAIPTLCSMEGREAIPVLQRLLEHADDRVRNRAFDQLMQWPDTLPVPKLARLLHGQKGMPLFAAGRLLALRGDKESLAALEKAVFSPLDAERLDASNALEFIRTPDALPMLTRVMKTGGIEAQRHGASVLGTLKDKRAVPPLVDALSSTDVELRHTAAAALGYFDDPRIIEPLLRSLMDPQPSVRIPALMSLSEKRDSRILPALQLLTDEKDPEVHKSVLYAIWMQRMQHSLQK